MKLLVKLSLRDNVKFVVLLIFSTYIFLIWNSNCDMSTFGKSLELKYEQDRSWNISVNRLLAIHELKKDSYKTYARQKYTNYGTNKNIKSEAEKKSTYTKTRGDGLNTFDAYMKDYKNRYTKKKGIAKLDCYYERKLFNKINNIFEITDNMKNKKKYYNKKIYNKYVMRLVLFSIIPFLGFIFILYFSNLNTYMEKACFRDCNSKHKGNGTFSSNENDAINDHQQEGRHLISITSEDFKIIDIVNKVFLALSTTIVLFVLLYTLLKIIKYARIKSGKCKIV